MEGGEYGRESDCLSAALRPWCKAMTGPTPTKRTRMMVEAYEAGGSLSNVGAQFGVSRQRIQQIMKRHAPKSIRPSGRHYGQTIGPSDKVREMVEAYEAGATLCEVAAQFGVLMTTVHKHIQRHALRAMRPPYITRLASVGPPGRELYRQGTCKTCEVSLWGYRPEPRALCGHCANMAEAAA